MKVSLNQRGSSHLVLVLAALVIVAVGAVGYKVMNSNQGTPSTSVASSNEAKVPDSIKSTADVKKAQAALQSTDVDKNVNPNQLDKDLNAL